MNDLIYADVDDIAQSYIDQGWTEQKSYEQAYFIVETGLKPAYRAKKPDNSEVRCDA